MRTKLAVLFAAVIGVVGLAVPATATPSSRWAAARPAAVETDAQVLSLFRRGESAYKAWAAVKSDANSMLQASFTLQGSITEIRAELSVAHGSTAVGQSARRLLIQAYGWLLRAANVDEQIQNNSLQIYNCGGDVSCTGKLVDASVALKGPLISDLVNYLSLRKAVINTFRRK